MGRSTSARIIAVSVFLFMILGTRLRPSTAYASDLHCFDQTGFCVSNPTIWDYFTHRGGVNAFGYPVSRQFLFQESQVQFFQRRVIQIEPNGQAGLLNVLDPGLMPYTEFNGATFPAIDSELTASAPSPTDQAATLAWVKEYTPDTWNGVPVNFYKTFSDTVTCAIAYPAGNCQTQFIPGFNLEMWGIPTSLPMMDPNNHNFVYLRFQRGVMMYNSTNGSTQGMLLADYLKSIMLGQGMPNDLAQEACGNEGLGPSPFCNQWGLIDTAFSPDDPTTKADMLSQIESLTTCDRAYLMELYPNGVADYDVWGNAPNPNLLPPFCKTTPAPQPTLNRFDFVIRLNLARPQVHLAPGVSDALYEYTATIGPIPTLYGPTPSPVPPPTPTRVPYPYPPSNG